MKNLTLSEVTDQFKTNLEKNYFIGLTLGLILNPWCTLYVFQALNCKCLNQDAIIKPFSIHYAFKHVLTNKFILKRRKHSSLTMRIWNRIKAKFGGIDSCFFFVYLPFLSWYPFLHRHDSSEWLPGSLQSISPTFYERLFDDIILPNSYKNQQL